MDCCGNAAAITWHKQVNAMPEQQTQAARAADIATYLGSLRTCKALLEGKKIHIEIARNGLEQNPALANGIVHMYLVCNSVQHARRMFDKLPSRGVALWAPMIAAYAQNGHLDEAFQLFQRMLEEGVVPDKVTFLTVMNACSDRGNLAEAKLVHARICGSGLERDVTIGTALLRMYTKCGSIEDSRIVFCNELFPKNVMSWTALISALVKHDQCQEAVHLFWQMLQEGVAPNGVTFGCVLNACAAAAAARSEDGLKDGRRIHALVAECGLESDAFVGTALIKIYRNCASLEDALLVFDGIAPKNVVVWNTMMGGYARHGHGEAALKLFRKMQLEGIRADKTTLLTTLDVYASLEVHGDGSHIHDCVAETGLGSDTLVGTALTKMHSRFGNVEAARVVFARIRHRDLVSWNTMFSAFAKHGLVRDAMQLLQEMKLEQVKPDKVTFVSILSACTSCAALEEGKLVHDEIVNSGLQLDAVLGTALVRMYGSCGSLENARLVFEKILRRDAISWTAMLGVYAEHGHHKEAFQVFQRMQLEGERPDKITLVTILNACSSPAYLAGGKALHKRIAESGFERDTVVANALLNMFGKCGNLEDAQRMFDKMDEPDLVSWNALIAAYAQHGQPKEALDCFLRMQLNGVTADNFTLVTIINSRASLSLFELVHASILEAGVHIDDALGTALVNMYGKCGNLVAAQETFNTLHLLNVTIWNSMIAAYAQHGYPAETIEVFGKMLQEGMKPDNVTFVSLLSACSHAGLVEEGCGYFVSMQEDLGIVPTAEHYGCMIDLLGRAGWLIEAEELLNRMPVSPDFSKWMALLSACKVYGSVEQGMHAAKHVLELNLENPAAHVVVSNMYAHST